MFLLIVGHGPSFSLTGTPPSQESEVRELIAPHETISTACVDLLLPCGYLEYKSSRLIVSLKFFHFKQIEPCHSPPLVQESVRSFIYSKDKKIITSVCIFKVASHHQVHYD